MFLLTTLISSPFIASLGLSLTALLTRILLLEIGINWLFFALVILFVGGIIVLFMYICSLTRSLKIETNKILIFVLIALLSIFLSLNQELIIRRYKLQRLIMSNLFRPIRFRYLVFLANYLLIGLVVVISLTNKFVGPLKNNISHEK